MRFLVALREVDAWLDRFRHFWTPHLDALANHEAFTDHFMHDFSFSGPAAGIGAKARFRTRPNDWMDLEVLESQAPVRTVERTVGAGGRRVTRGTYTLTEEPGGGTRVSFELVYEQGPASERMAAPLVRGPGSLRGRVRRPDRVPDVKSACCAVRPGAGGRICTSGIRSGLGRSRGRTRPLLGIAPPPIVGSRRGMPCRQCLMRAPAPPATSA